MSLGPYQDDCRTAQRERGVWKRLTTAPSLESHGSRRRRSEPLLLTPAAGLTCWSDIDQRVLPVFVRRAFTVSRIGSRPPEESDPGHKH